MLFKKLIYLCYSDILDTLNNDKNNIKLIIDNYYLTFLNYNILLKFLILSFIFAIVIINIFFIILYFFKFKLNFFSNSTKFLSKFPYLKNINNFIKANLFLHIQ